MKKLAGFLAFSLLSAGIISAQEAISTSPAPTNSDVLEAQLQIMDNALATDGDVLIKDKRKKGQDIIV